MSITKLQKLKLKKLQKLNSIPKTRGEMIQKAVDRYINFKMERYRFGQFKRKHFPFIYERDGGMCWFCHQPVSETECTLDHLTPSRRSGKLKVSNLAVCCKECNLDKGMLTAEEYIKIKFS